MRRLYGYLLNERCLDRDVVHAFVHEGLLYEDVPNHNAVFVGTDENGKPRHVQKRSTNPQSDFHDDSNICSSDTSSSMAKIQGVEGLENTQFYIYLQYCKQCDILILHYSGYV